MFLKRLLHYLNPANFFRKTKADINTRMMHGINTFSIWVFLICFVVLLVKWIA